MSYEQAGVNINNADAAKKVMAQTLSTENPRVLNAVGAFASLYDFSFSEMKSPVIVVKMEEPGSKQLLAAQHGRLPDIGYDLVNHLINDTVMMGARPLVVLDTIVCGKLDKNEVCDLVATMAAACKAQGCDLVGGETSEQPRVIPAGTYILSACCVGVVDRSRIVDGSKIQAGDVVLGVASNGIHTNGYSLVRSLLDKNPAFGLTPVDNTNFLDAALRPHVCYNQPLQALFRDDRVRGLAHVTGGGIVDNLSRVIPGTLTAKIDLKEVRVLEIFKAIAREGDVAPVDMLRTFNLGIGLVVVAPAAEASAIVRAFGAFGLDTYQIGRIEGATVHGPRVETSGQLRLV